MSQPEIKILWKQWYRFHIWSWFFLTKINAGNKSFFVCMTKTPGSAKKIKIIINKSNFIFISVLEKLGSADFVNQKNKKWWPYLQVWWRSDNKTCRRTGQLAWNCAFPFWSILESYMHSYQTRFNSIKGFAKIDTVKIWHKKFSLWPWP